MKYCKLIGCRIKELRERRRLTQQYLADKMGFNKRSSYSEIENGFRDICLEKHLQPICNILKVKVIDILDFEKTIDDILFEEYQIYKNYSKAV